LAGSSGEIRALEQRVEAVLAAEPIWNFPHGANFDTTVAFFETSSATTDNDYIIAFGNSPKLVTIRDGRRTSGLSKTHWIGDKAAYEKFREYEHRTQELRPASCWGRDSLASTNRDGVAVCQMLPFVYWSLRT
jgi:hypothetical protein